MAPEAAAHATASDHLEQRRGLGSTPTPSAPRWGKMAGQKPQSDNRTSKQHSEGEPRAGRSRGPLASPQPQSAHSPDKSGGKTTTAEDPEHAEEPLISGPRSCAQNLRREGGGSRSRAGGGLNLGLPRSQDLASTVWGKREEIRDKTSRGRSELEVQVVAAKSAPLLPSSRLSPTF